MNAKQRKDYWVKMDRLRKTLENKYKQGVVSSIKKQFSKFAKDVKTYGTSAAISRLGLDAWNKELYKVFEDMYKESAVIFGNATYRALKIQANQKGDTFGFNKEWTEALLKFISTKGFELVSMITKTTRDKLISIVEKAVIDGLGVDQIVKLILADETIGYTAFRAERIVRTEVMRASNLAAMNGAKSHNFEVDKQWISARDSRTRRIPADEFDHIELDGVVVDFNDPFTSTGKKGEPVVAMQPGDLSAPAGFTINCRCTVGFIPKRDKNGNLIMKSKKSGINVSNVNNQQIIQSQADTKQDVVNSIQNLFNSFTNLVIKKVNIPSTLTKEQLISRRDVLEKLVTEYKLSPGINNKVETNIYFQSTSKSYGFVRSSFDGKYIYDINFGDRYDSSKSRIFDPNFRGIRYKSRVDEKNLEFATTVHEFGHLMALRFQLKQIDPAEELVKYYKELKKINRQYRTELGNYAKDGDFYNVNQISLGDYANTNIDEFMAEAFTEYRLSSNPSKYAKLVGELIDKYFKK